MAKKRWTGWTAFLGGVALSLGSYLAALCLLALLTVREVLPETALFPATVVCCALAAALGGGLGGARSPLGRVPGSAACGAAFCVVLAAAGGLIWGELDWMGEGGILALAALGGGAVGGLPGRKRSRKLRRNGGRR